jgi:hypothetical protein
MTAATLWIVFLGCATASAGTLRYNMFGLGCQIAADGRSGRVEPTRAGSSPASRLPDEPPHQHLLLRSCMSAFTPLLSWHAPS